MAWRARATSFEALALTQAPALNILGNSGAEQIPRVQTTSDIFKVFGLTILLGREFTEEDTRPGAPPVVILAHGFWQRAFGGDPSVLGRRLAIPAGSLTIVGVAPVGLRIGAVDPDVYTPITLDPADPGATGSRAFQVYGRLKSGLTLDQARAEMATIAGDLSRQLPLDKDMGVVVASLHDDLVNDARPALRLLMAVVATVLLIACVNLASLLTARGISRRGELALRASLGASRGRIVRQLVVESLVLSSLGGVAGFALAELATRALVSLSAGALSAGTADPVRLDALCLTFTLCVSMLTAVIFGLVPAWQASHVDPQTALRERARGASADRRQHRLRAALVMTEVALAVVLLIGAGLLLRTFSNLANVNLGFQPAQTFAMNLFLGLRPPEVRVNVIDQDPRSRRGRPRRQRNRDHSVPSAERHGLRDGRVARRPAGGGCDGGRADGLCSRQPWLLRGDGNSGRRGARLRQAGPLRRSSSAHRQSVVCQAVLQGWSRARPAIVGAGLQSGRCRSRGCRWRYSARSHVGTCTDRLSSSHVRRPATS